MAGEADKAILAVSKAEVGTILRSIDTRLLRLKDSPPLPQASMLSLNSDFALRYVHETTAIEGNTLTLHETQAVLEEGITIGGKTLREHLEIVNTNAALEWLDDVLQRRLPITEILLLDMHRILMSGILKDEAGFYRRQPVYIRGSRHVPPNWATIPDRMAVFIDELGKGSGTQHPIAFAAAAHVRLAGIHPFIDGNGRASRLLTNLLLMQHDYPPALYTATNRRTYMLALEIAQVDNNPLPFVAVTARATEFMLDRQLRLVAMEHEAARHIQDSSQAHKPRQVPPSKPRTNL